MSDENDNPPTRSGWRWARWTGAVLALVLILLVAGVLWIINTPSGTRWAANRAVGFLAGKLEIGDIEGALAGPLVVTGIRFNDPDAGADVRVERVMTDIAVLGLLSRRVHVKALEVSGVDVRLSEPKPKEEEPHEPFSLDPPIDLVLDRFTLKGARVSRDGEDLFIARSAEAQASWTKSDGIAIRQFLLDSPDGNVRLTANAAGEGSDVSTFHGQADGHFRWRVGNAQYVGELSAHSEKQELQAEVRLTAPFTAKLDAAVGQNDEVPWRFTLTVPRFDPRRELLPDSSIRSLAANLEAHGDLTVAELRGDVAMNDQSLRIDPARVRYREQVVTIEALNLRDPSRKGTLSASGIIRLPQEASANADATTVEDGSRDAETPGTAEEGVATSLFADLDVRWNGVELPPEWVGQVLHTEGRLKVGGSPDRFNANGQFALGPPGKPSNIALALAGTPEQIGLDRLEILQPSGSLNVHGRVQLQPRLGWQLEALAKQFDPGLIVAGWPGSLGFALDTNGELLEAGPRAALNLEELSGQLRDRPVAGKAALTLSPQKVIAGTLNVRSGRSSVSLEGDAGEALNVDTVVNIASLEDWVPGTTGRVRGRFHVEGQWPNLAINGNAQGDTLAFGDYSVRTLEVVADVRNPQAPSGTVRVTAREALAAGFEINQASLEASGDEQAHTLLLQARGQPLGTTLRLEGGREGEDGWKGVVQQLDLLASGLSPVSLRSPVNVSVNPREFDVSEACLTGDQVSACVAASQAETGELNARYVLERLPLGLVTALVAPQLPLQIEAVVQGNGQLRRTPEGELYGEAHLASSSGRVSESSTLPREDEQDALLTYENFAFDAQLAGSTAQASVSTMLNGSGRLEGNAALSGFGGPAPTVEGRANLSIPDLSPIELFVPQVASVKGTAEANVQVSGYLSEPQLSGEARVQQLSAEVPLAGIHLKDGELQASMSPEQQIAVRGQLSSGNGSLTLDGGSNAEGTLNVSLRGENFMAANIPGARVIIAPDLKLARTQERMQLTGKVTIPEADIDLTKLPRTSGGTQASPDVVVIDDEAPDDEAARRAMPLVADISVVVGEKVHLIGYGLDAQLAGRLDVRERPGNPTTGSGEIRVSGRYKAYGQDLTIEQGRLLFAGQPLADPQINLVAYRKVDTVTARLTVTGSARQPILQVSADPAMSQTQALSYLVTGKPLNEVGQGEGDLVQSAARSLGGAAGNLLAKGLGRRLGIDQIGVEDSDELGGAAAFTVGQYLSPRLYLSYGVGLFEPGQVLTLRYRISDKWSLEASQGPQSQRAGINYRVEKR